MNGTRAVALLGAALTVWLLLAETGVVGADYSARWEEATYLCIGVAGFAAIFAFGARLRMARRRGAFGLAVAKVICASFLGISGWLFYSPVVIEFVLNGIPPPEDVQAAKP